MLPSGRGEVQYPMESKVSTFASSESLVSFRCRIVGGFAFGIVRKNFAQATGQFCSHVGPAIVYLEVRWRWFNRV